MAVEARSPRSVLANVAEVAGYHLKDVRRSSGSMNLTVMAGLALVPPLALVWFTYFGTGLPNVPALAMTACAAALLAPLAFFFSGPAPFAESAETVEDFYTTTGWSPLEKFLGWVWAMLRTQLPLVLILGAEVLVYWGVAALYPDLGIGVFPVTSVPAGAGAPAASSFQIAAEKIRSQLFELLPRLAVTWLALPLYLLGLTLVRIALRVYAGSEILRKGLLLVVWLLVMPLGLIYVQLLNSGGSATISEVIAGSATPLGILPGLLLMGLVPLVFIAQPLMGERREWVSRALIWGIPGYLTAWLGGLVVMQFTGFHRAVEWLVESPVALLPLDFLRRAYLLLNPFNGLEALLNPSDPAQMYWLSESFRGSEQFQPQLAFSVEVLLLVFVLLWTTALLVQAWLGYARRHYGEDPWS